MRVSQRSVGYLAPLAVAALVLTGCGSTATTAASTTPIPVWTAVPAVANVATSMPASKPADTSQRVKVAAIQQQAPAMGDTAIGRIVGPAVVQVTADFGANTIKPESGGSGSGFSIDHRRGLIVTAAHVVEGAASITVLLPDHERVPAYVVGRSDCDDLALLKISVTHGLAQVGFGNSDQVQLGDPIVAFGYPLPALGRGLSLNPGTVAQLHTPLLNYQDLLGIDAALNLGSSGGPIVNQQARVIGITVLGVNGAENTHFAVASTYAAQILQQLAHGQNLHYIGLNVVANGSRYRSFYGTTRGMIVAGVTSGSPADQIGVQPGDLLMRVEGSEVSDPGHLCAILSSRPDGAVIKVRVYRPSRHQILDGEMVIGKLGVAGPATQTLAPAQ